MDCNGWPLGTVGQPVGDHGEDRQPELGGAQAAHAVLLAREYHQRLGAGHGVQVLDRAGHVAERVILAGHDEVQHGQLWAERHDVHLRHDGVEGGFVRNPGHEHEPLLEGRGGHLVKWPVVQLKAGVHHRAGREARLGRRHPRRPERAEGQAPNHDALGIDLWPRRHCLEGRGAHFAIAVGVVSDSPCERRALAGAVQYQAGEATAQVRHRRHGGDQPADDHPLLRSKQDLFATAARVDFRMPDLAAVAAEARGRALVRHVLDQWDAGDELPALLRAAGTHDKARARLVEAVERQAATVIAAVLPAERSGERLAMIVMRIAGLALKRYVLKHPSVIALDRETLIRRVGTAIQRYLTPNGAGD